MNTCGYFSLEAVGVLLFSCDLEDWKLTRMITLLVRTPFCKQRNSVCSGGLWHFLVVGLRLNDYMIHQMGLLVWFI